MPKKKTVIFLLTLIAVSLVIGGVYILANRQSIRRPTRQEIEACAPYAIDWQFVTGQEGSDKEIILSMCTFVEEKNAGEMLISIYESDTLGSYLWDFQEMMEISEFNGILYVTYTTPDGGMVTLGYDDTGMTEKGIYRQETDTYYFRQGDTFEVWTNFRNGFQLGF